MGRWKQQLTAMSGQLADREEKEIKGAIAAVEAFDSSVEVTSS